MQDAMQAFTQCMRSNGVDMPDPPSGGGAGPVTRRGPDPDDDDVQAAQKKCQSKLPRGAGINIRGGGPR